MDTIYLHKNVRQNRGGVFLNLLFLFSIIIVIIIFSQTKTVCESPLQYSLGTVDKKFNITDNNLFSLVLEAESVWEEGTGMELFSYNPKALFKINLIFDKRQRKTIAEKRARLELDIGGDSHATLTKKYENLLLVYDKKFKKYNEDVISYEEKLNSYNIEVNSYNKIGGAPQSKYNELEKTRTNLKIFALDLKQKSNELNILNKQVKEFVDKINNFADVYNTEVAQYNSAFGAARTFDQGEYTGNKINIYQFDEEKDLRLVLAHEFGHALNLEHVENPKSIMYYLMDKQNQISPVLSKEDIQALKIECNLL